jgi:biopolymer transport protein TolR
MAGFKSPQDDSPMADINITPFVDVMLVLLVIFMVTAPLMEQGIPIQLPKASSKALPPKDTEGHVVLHLTKESRIFVNKEEFQLSVLSPRLRDFYKTRERKEIYIRADASLPYGFVAQVMSTVKNAGIHKIGLVTAPEEPTKEKK